MFYRHKFFKIILTHLAKHDILCHKSHGACRGNAPPSCFARPLCRLKAPLGLSLLRKRGLCGLILSTRCGRVHFEHSHRKWLVITVRPTTSVRKSPRRIYRPATHPIHFAADSPDKIHRCAAWAVFFFFTNKILCSCSIFQNLFFVVDCTTVKCYSCA